LAWPFTSYEYLWTGPVLKPPLKGMADLIMDQPQDIGTYMHG